jgi:hypothetical protein
MNSDTKNLAEGTTYLAEAVPKNINLMLTTVNEIKN